MHGVAAAVLARDDVTVFDSTGLAIQDLAIALAAMERATSLTSRRSTSDVSGRLDL